MVTQWQDGHFVGGHAVLDLTNTVFSRAHPVADNDLLGSAADVLAWCEAARVLDRSPQVTEASGRRLLADVREVRDDAWSVFGALASGGEAPGEAFGTLLGRAGVGLRAGRVRRAEGGFRAAEPIAAQAIAELLSAMAVDAVFTLRPQRVRSCDRCGWLFLDTSRGGRRRWCDMSTCGNREKASRHRSAVK